MIKILVVEDDENLNLSVCKHLSAHGYLAKGCLDAISAIDTLSAEKHDLIISDMSLINISEPTRQEAISYA